MDERTQHDRIQICSMAASTYAKEGEAKKFLAYVKPTCAFQPIASRINGMTMEGDNLVKDGKIVETALSLRHGLQDFLTFIETVKDDEAGDTRIVLAAHNCFKFDAKVLLKNLRMFGLQLPIKILFEDCFTRGRFSLDSCLSHYFNVGQGVHKAESDTGFDTFESFLRSNPSLVRNVTM